MFQGNKKCGWPWVNGERWLAGAGAIIPDDVEESTHQQNNNPWLTTNPGIPFPLNTTNSKQNV